MATNDDMNMYNSKYTGKQIDDGLDVIYQEKDGIKSIPPNVFFATNENGEANPISTNTIINTNSLEDKLQNYVTLDSRQTITGAKTFKAGASFYQSDDSNLSMNINGKGVTVVNSGSQGMGSLSLDWHSIQISTPSGRGQLVFGFNSSETTTIAFPPTSGTIALLSDIPSLPTNYVTSNTEQTINGLKTFVGGLNIQGNNLNIAPDGNLVFNTSNGQKIRFVLPTSNPTGTVDITLPITSKDMNEIGNGGTLQFVGTNYGEGELDTKWTESPQGVDAELGKYYVDVSLEEGDTIVSIRTTSNYGLSENSITTLGANKETWPEIKNDNRLIIETNKAGTISKKVRIYSNAKISGRAQIAVGRQS